MRKRRSHGITRSTYWQLYSKSSAFFTENLLLANFCHLHSRVFHLDSIAPAMFLSDYAYNRGLQHTTVASSTVLVSTSCIFVLFLSVLLGVEPFRYGKLLGVIFAVVGTAMTTWHDAVRQDEINDMQPEYEDKDMIYGDMFSLMAAVGYAAYSVQARILCPQDEELYSMALLLGYVGVICSVPLLPMALYKMMTMTGISWHTVIVLIIKGLLDFLVTDYLLFRAVMLTNATVANVGLGLTIPLAFAADLVFQSIPFTHLQVAGAFTVLAGFILVNWMSSLDEAEASQTHSEGISRTSTFTEQDSVKTQQNLVDRVVV